MVELIPAKCPSCGADLKLPDNLEKAFCLYCGTTVIIKRNDTIQVRQAVFICEVCGKKKTLRHYSGVDGRSLCLDCYYEADDMRFRVWIVGALLLLIGFIPLITGRQPFIVIGFALIIAGVFILSASRFLSP